MSLVKNELMAVLRNEFKESAEHKRKFSFDIKFNNPFDKIQIKASSVWTPSNCFVSAGSFNIDKTSSAFSHNHSQQLHYFANGGLNKVNRLEVSLLSSQQTRSFKTYRSLISDSQRNPTILSRLKEAYNQPGGKMNPIVSAQVAQTLQNESLTKLLSQTDVNNLTPEQKQQLKIAFAEGYLAANHPDNAQKSGRAMKYLKVFQQLLVICVFMGIFLSLFASNNGSVFR